MVGSRGILFTIQASWMGPLRHLCGIFLAHHLVHHPHKADGVQKRNIKTRASGWCGLQLADASGHHLVGAGWNILLAILPTVWQATRSNVPPTIPPATGTSFVRLTMPFRFH